VITIMSQAAGKSSRIVALLSGHRVPGSAIGARCDILGRLRNQNDGRTCMAHREKQHLSRRSFIAATIATAAGTWSLPAARAQSSNVNFRMTGSQDPTLLFVHGFACALDDWDAQVNALSPRFRCAALDLPGHGASAKPATVSIAAMGSAVAQVKEQIGARSTVLIGHSMGCRVIVEALLQSPSGVAGLVFVDGSILGGDPETGVNRAKEAVSRAGVDALTQRLFGDMFVETSDPKLRERLIARAQGVDAALREELFVDLVRWDLTKARDALKQIKVPALVLQSTFINPELKRVPMQAGTTTPFMDAVASSVAKSEARIVTGAGHFAMIEAAPSVTDEIGKFAARVA
jgi:pimeloyl-ACP methyl ester carboxylesterase